jgi:mono/diheme cytochrome c family protein
VGRGIASLRPRAPGGHRVAVRLKSVIKWLAVGLGGIVAFALIGVGVVWVIIGRDLGRRFDVRGSEITVPADAASISEGARLARLRGCNGGCHGDTAEGSVFFELFDGTRVVAPDLGGLAAEYSAADLEGVIRHGVRPDGSGVLGVCMPSEMFQHLNDADLGKIIAFVRDQPPREVELLPSRYGPVARLMLLQLKQRYDALLAAELIDHDAPRVAASGEDPLVRGRYLALSVCTECHGADLRGIAEEGTPDLAIVTAYSSEDFHTLMRTGVPLGGRKLGMMADVALSRFAYFTDEEIEDVYGYLKTLAGTPLSQSMD